MYKPLVSILGDFYENRFLFIEALYVVNLPSVRGLWMTPSNNKDSKVQNYSFYEMCSKGEFLAEI